MKKYAHKASISLPFLAFSLGDIVFPGEIREETARGQDGSAYSLGRVAEAT